jgi:hypothetical protein
VAGRRSFTRSEVDELRRLIREKQTADQDRQKVLRGKIRRIGFYISDFADYPGFTVSDFDDLLDRGAISCSDTPAGAAPIPASAGQTNGDRLDRGGHRKLNRALCKRSCSPAAANTRPTVAYNQRHSSGGKTTHLPQPGAVGTFITVGRRSEGLTSATLIAASQPEGVLGYQLELGGCPAGRGTSRQRSRCRWSDGDEDSGLVHRGRGGRASEAALDHDGELA